MEEEQRASGQRRWVRDEWEEIATGSSRVKAGEMNGRTNESKVP